MEGGRAAAAVSNFRLSMSGLGGTWTSSPSVQASSAILQQQHMVIPALPAVLDQRPGGSFLSNSMTGPTPAFPSGFGPPRPVAGQTTFTQDAGRFSGLPSQPDFLGGP